MNECVATLALAYPNLIVMFLSSSFLNRTVWTPEMALTTVDLPWATWPIVPMLIVACLEMTSGDRGCNWLRSRSVIFLEMLELNEWVFSESECRQSPSALSGMAPEVEAWTRIRACRFLDRCAKKLAV